MIPGLDADGSRFPVGVSSPFLLSTECNVLLVVCWFAGMGQRLVVERENGSWDPHRMVVVEKLW